MYGLYIPATPLFINKQIEDMSFHSFCRRNELSFYCILFNVVNSFLWMSMSTIAQSYRLSSKFYYVDYFYQVKQPKLFCFFNTSVLFWLQIKSLTIFSILIGKLQSVLKRLIYWSDFVDDIIILNLVLRHPCNWGGQFDVSFDGTYQFK